MCASSGLAKGTTMLYQLLYSSIANDDISVHEMRKLLADSRARNVRIGVTGVLIFYAETREIVQVLEGPKEAVLGLLERIRCDKRHRNVIVHFEARVAKRDLGAWPMGFLSAKSDAPHSMGTRHAAGDQDDRNDARQVVGARLLNFIRGSSPRGATLH